MKLIPKKTTDFHIVFAIFSILTIFAILIFFKADNEINKSNIEFINGYKWEVEEKPTDIVHITIPEEFDPVFAAYSKIVSRDGYDLNIYRGKGATRYSYKVINHRDSNSGLIRINITVCDNKIIAADISSLAADGFILPISNTSGII